MLTHLALLNNIHHDPSRTESSTMKASSVTVGAVALTLFAATMGTLPDSTDGTRETETDGESLFTDQAPDDGGSLDVGSIIGDESVYGTVGKGVLDGLKPSSATALRNEHKKRNRDAPTVIVKPTTKTTGSDQSGKDSSA
jgi:hypothetical protein